MNSRVIPYSPAPLNAKVLSTKKPCLAPSPKQSSRLHNCTIATRPFKPANYLGLSSPALRRNSHDLIICTAGRRSAQRFPIFKVTDSPTGQWAMRGSERGVARNSLNRGEQRVGEKLFSRTDSLQREHHLRTCESMPLTEHGSGNRGSGWRGLKISATIRRISLRGLY